MAKRRPGEEDSDETEDDAPCRDSEPAHAQDPALRACRKLSQPEMSPQFGRPGPVELIQTVPSNPERRDSDHKPAAGDLERSGGPVRRLATGRSYALTRSQPKR